MTVNQDDSLSSNYHNHTSHCTTTTFKRHFHIFPLTLTYHSSHLSEGMRHQRKKNSPTVDAFRAAAYKHALRGFVAHITLTFLYSSWRLCDMLVAFGWYYRHRT